MMLPELAVKLRALLALIEEPIFLMSPLVAVMFKLLPEVIWAWAIELVLLVSEAMFKVKSPPLTIAPLLVRAAVGEFRVRLVLAKMVEPAARAGELVLEVEAEFEVPSRRFLVSKLK